MKDELSIVNANSFLPKVKQYLDDRAAAASVIPEERKRDLAEVATYIRDRAAKSQDSRLTFICT